MVKKGDDMIVIIIDAMENIVSCDEHLCAPPLLVSQLVSPGTHYLQLGHRGACRISSFSDWIVVFIKHDVYIVIFFSFHPSKLTLSIGYSVTWSNLVNALDIALSEISLAVLRFPD